MKISINAKGMMIAAVSAATLLFAAVSMPRVDAADLIKVKVGDTTSLAQLGMYAGIQKGIFQKHGIDIERIAIPGGAKVMGALLSGDIDIGYLAGSTSLQAQFQGRPVKIIGMSHSMEIYTLLGQNTLKDKIKSPADLKDRTIGISAIGSGSWAFANFLAYAGSLDASRDIKIVPLGNMMAIISALKTNRVDTVTLWEPGTTIALKENAGYSIVDLVDPAQHEKYLHSPHSLVEVILVKEELLSTKQDMLRKFFAAQNEAYDWLHSTPMEEVAKVVAPILGDSNMDALVPALKRNLAGVPAVATVDQATFESSMRTMVQTGLFKEALPFAKSVDNTYAASR
jgi:ABC-type nitrate/sulfonate/bicarbonate transport system substrate-binding protein